MRVHRGHRRESHVEHLLAESSGGGDPSHSHDIAALRFRPRQWRLHNNDSPTDRRHQWSRCSCRKCFAHDAQLLLSSRGSWSSGARSDTARVAVDVRDSRHGWHASDGGQSRPPQQLGCRSMRLAAASRVADCCTAPPAAARANCVAVKWRESSRAASHWPSRNADRNATLAVACATNLLA